MPITTRQTVSTTRGGTTTQHHVIPMWTIKLITAILSIVVLVLVLLQSTNHWQRYTKTYLCIVLTNGYLLGWSLPSVLNRFLPFHKVDVALHTFSCVITVLALVLSAIYLLDNRDYSRTDDYRLMIGITICVCVEAILLFILVSWVCYGNYTIVDSR
ncbi:unnamed protein product [Bursaphelenchus okinawaensis]|uniref:MARVEL domain-containing protein n=1 Tax=Bursaphelenchus okinawaensis TaxID=465554 RepID=A0A811KQG0_9BILA|nr:unnamed protein product [Bursaphelenchus okinawaensis]CAG9110412.1 unnamed protein product [Bursaphelenchus okinawaensis]